jgi:hypothetical protein
MKASRLIPPLTTEQIEKFWKNITIKSADECWEWKGPVTGGGYGNFYIRHNDLRLAHRVAWYLSNHRQPNAYLVCHHCDNRSCCNPSHLFLGTSKDNTSDAMEKGRMRSYFLPKENHPMAKLNEIDVEEIKNLHNLGFSQNYIAEKFKINQSQVSRILSGRRW